MRRRRGNTPGLQPIREVPYDHTPEEIRAAWDYLVRSGEFDSD
jgi:hypothetical protein